MNTHALLSVFRLNQTSKIGYSTSTIRINENITKKIINIRQDSNIGSGSLEIVMIFACAILSINIILFTLDMLTFYISIELFSFTSFFLILITPDKVEVPVKDKNFNLTHSLKNLSGSSTVCKATINAFIYFIFNTISSIIILIYFLLIYKNFGFLNFSNITVTSTILSVINIFENNEFCGVSSASGAPNLEF